MWPNQGAAANGGGPSPLQSAHLVAAVAELGSLGRTTMNVKRVVKFQIIFAVLILAGGLSLTAIVNHAQSSALAPLSYFPYLLGVVLGGTAHSPSLTGYVIGLILEWGLIGLLLSGPLAVIVTLCWKEKDSSHDTKKVHDTAS